MIYTEEQLSQIEKFASIYLKISDMAVILDLPAEQLREDIARKESDVSKRYYRGKASSKVKLLHQEMLLAQVNAAINIQKEGLRLLSQM